MDQNTLVTEQIEAGNDFIRRFQNYAPVTVAFWLKPAEVGRWSLYVVSDHINADNRYSAYGEVVRIGAEMHNSEFNLFGIKLVPADSPFARDAVDARQYYPAGRTIHFDAKTFGDVSVEDVYFYPSQATEAASLVQSR